MKVLHVIRDMSVDTGGPVTFIKDLIRIQKKNGDEVVVITTDYDHARINIDPDLISMFIFCPCQFAPLRFSSQLYRVLSEWILWCDVVHIHTIWEYPTLVAAIIARRLGRPFLLRPCGMLVSWSMSQSAWKKCLYLKFFYKTLFSSPCVLHFTTEAEKRKSKVVAGRDSVVVESGVSEIAFLDYSKTDFFKYFPQLKEVPIVLFLGRIHPKKNPDLVIRSFFQIVEIYPDARLVIAGPGEKSYLQSLKELVATLGISNKVFFVGPLKGSVLYSAYHCASLFLLPSAQENFGLAVVEAMAAGCPVIVSNNVDIHKEIEQGGAGLVCPLRPKNIAIAMEKIIGDAAMAINMGRQGKEVAKKYFSLEANYFRLKETYIQIIKGVQS